MGDMPAAGPGAAGPRPSVFDPPASPSAEEELRPVVEPVAAPARGRHRQSVEAAGLTEFTPSATDVVSTIAPVGPELPVAPDWIELTAPPIPTQRGSTVRPTARRGALARLGLGLTAPGLVVSLVLIALAAVAAFVAIARWQQPEVVREGVVTSSVVPTAVATAGPGATAGPTTVSPTRGTVRPAKVRLGVFRGTSSGQVYGFQRWLGRDVDYVVDFTRRDSWSQVADPHEMIDYWAGTRYRLVVSTPLLAENGRSTMAAGARGRYDKYYRNLARNLVKGGQQDAVIRLGWEFNLGSSAWATGDPAVFISYWRRVVVAMRSVPGQHFRFDWNVNVGETSYDGAAYYPGAHYVDYVGVDVYDVSWDPQTYPYPVSCDTACRLPRQRRVWQRLYGGQHGLAYWSDFARSKGKPMSLPEWGLWGRTDGHGGQDDPYFIQQMYRFITDPANRVAYQAYFEANLPKDRHSLRQSFPVAAETFRKLFGRS